MMIQQTEQDIRLDMLNSLLTSPHRDLASTQKVHEKLIKDDPLFYRQLAAWYNNNGDIRDHKDAFIINLCLSSFEGHRDVGLALLRNLPPFRLTRVLDFIRSKEGLRRNLPRSVKTEVTRYLREREDNPQWFDSNVLNARKHIKRLYASLKIPTSERAQQILFDEVVPEDSILTVARQLKNASSPAEQAQLLMNNKVPYRIASSLIKNMTPSVLYALAKSMTDQELINNVGSLQKRGAFDNPDIREFIQDRLAKAKTSTNVAALKSLEAVKSSNIDDEVREQLEDIADTQVKAKGKIAKPTAILIDKSGSMQGAIELGKQLAALVSSLSTSDLYVYAFDTMPYPITCNSTNVADWGRALQGINAGGGTSSGSAVVALTRNKQYVEQIVLITDECDGCSPAILTSVNQYCATMNVRPNFLFIHPRKTHGWMTISNKNNEMLARNGYDVEKYDFDGDYYSLPNLIPYLTRPSKLELLMEIMAYPLPKRKSVMQKTG